MCAGVITADDRAGTDLADAVCKLLVWEHRARKAGEQRGTRPSRPSRAWLIGLRALGLRGSDETFATFGFLGVDERLDDACVRDHGPCRCQHLRPSGDEGTRMSTAPQGAFARSFSTQSARRAVGALAQPPESAAQHCKSGLTALRNTESFISCREARWSQCSAPCVFRTVVVWCDNLCSATALAQRLLGDCWFCATCFSFFFLVPNAWCILIVFPGKFCVPRPISFPIRPASLFGRRAT